MISLLWIIGGVGFLWVCGVMLRKGVAARRNRDPWEKASPGHVMTLRPVSDPPEIPTLFDYVEVAACFLLNAIKVMVVIAIVAFFFWYPFGAVIYQTIENNHKGHQHTQTDKTRMQHKGKLKMVKYCEDCKHYERYEHSTDSNYALDNCSHSNVPSPHFVRRGVMEACFKMRKDDKFCGPSASWFKQGEKG